MQPETIADFGEHQQVQVTQPTSTAELGQAVRDAAAQGLAVFPLGGRTMLHLGYPPNKPGIGVDLRHLDQVIDYPARDMTITVQAGITIAKLQEILAKENQQLPVDVPFPDQATLGGAIAVNASGPRRYGYGTLRDYVIGTSFVNDEGQEVKAGGRVVKNVAGYDLMKLQIGALGTLGIVTQVTLKLRPKAEASRLLVLGWDESESPRLLELLSRSATHPICFGLLDQGGSYIISNLVSGDRWSRGAPCIGMARYSAWALVIGFEGNAQGVDWQVEQVSAEITRDLGYRPWICSPIEADGIMRALVDFPLLQDDTTLTFKANLLPGAVLESCKLQRTWQRDLKSGQDFALSANAGSGIVISHAFGNLTLEQARAMLTKLQDAVGPDGNVVVTRCPSEWKRQLPIWGKPRDDYALMRRVKHALDPHGIFNPGRFVDGI
jgi:glycolate oxidase FAD binding subunit